MFDFPSYIFTEPDDVDFDTLKNLGPLAPLAGIWEGKRGLDVHLNADGSKKDAYLERYELKPIDPQLNGPQLPVAQAVQLHKVADLTPNWLMRQTGPAGS